MCKRKEWRGNQVLDICGIKYDVVLKSFGDIRANKVVYGESPLSREFGVCLFDYVFAFVVSDD